MAGNQPLTGFIDPSHLARSKLRFVQDQGVAPPDPPLKRQHGSRGSQPGIMSAENHTFRVSALGRLDVRVAADDASGGRVEKQDGVPRLGE